VNDVVSVIIDVVFKNHMIYIFPAVFILTAILLADRVIDLVYSTFKNDKGY